MARKRRKRWHPPGTPPGTLSAHPEADKAPVRITLFRYDAAGLEERADPGLIRRAQDWQARKADGG